MNLASDLLEGADEIAAFIFGDKYDRVKRRRRVYHLVDLGAIPTFKLGTTICARKSQLQAWIEAQELRSRHASGLVVQQSAGAASGGPVNV